MNTNHILFFWALCLPCLLRAQGNCNNPISLASVLVSNTSCGNNTGTIIISPEGLAALYTYTWTPSVSNVNTAANLLAGTYSVHIERLGNSNCKLDTLIVVNNSNGPVVQATIEPADCLASNGAISLSPNTLLYNWSNGLQGSTITGLGSKNYYVTATNPSTNCYSVFKYFVPIDYNALNVSAQVQAHAKCGMSNGKAQIIVTGGSGQYSYNPGPGPQFNNLAAGNYHVDVVDNATGCAGSVDFTIQNLQVTGTVSITPHNVRCAGQATGFVEFDVSAGPNFQTPYVFFLRDANGNIYAPGPGSLVAGDYTLQIADADGCMLPAQSFSIKDPPPFTVQVQATPETCIDGGNITLTIAGGNGAPYIVDWADLIGNENPTNRTNLQAGLYSAIVYDSLFCTQMVANTLVAPACNNLENAHIFAAAGTVETFCVEQPTGLAQGATVFGLLSGGSLGNSAYGSWMLSANGCLAYTAGPNAGFAVDTICIVRTAAQIGLQDTTCLIVSISLQQPSKQTVYFTVQVDGSSTACGSIPSGLPSPVIVQLGRPGLSGSSDSYGHYTIDGSSACVTFFAAGTPGYNVDEIRAGVFDPVAKKSHIISYFPTVLPKTDCADALDLADTLHFITTGCTGLSSGCVPIPYDDIVNYTIIDNNALYNTGYVGCDFDTTLSYNLATLPPGGGPYELTEWKINGQSHTGFFLHLNGLVKLMNLLDPPASWAVQGVGYVRGGNAGKSYGPLKIKSATGSIGVFDVSAVLAPFGSELRFTPGYHTVLFRNVQSACADTVVVDAICVLCPPVHSYPVDGQGNVKWQAPNCASDTIFCTNIPNADLGQYLVTDNGQPFFDFTLCGNFVGMRLDTGYHELHFNNTSTTCEWSLGFYLECQNVVQTDTLRVNIPLGGAINVCPDISLLQPPVVSISNVCEDEGSTILGFSLDNQNWCVLLTGLSAGLDTLCIQICNSSDECVHYIVIANVGGTPTDSLLAVPDVAFTLKNEPLDLHIIANDIVGGIAGNLGGLSNVAFVTTPVLGDFFYNAATGVVSYVPTTGKCGIDSFTYRITDGMGRQSDATIKITISCDKILVFNGISPNGDGRNDTWHLLGIEQFPGNTVQVYNRWGNLVFEQKGYTNDAAWDGQWNGKDLPDGTYFYVLDLGAGNGKLSGWVEILR